MKVCEILLLCYCGYMIGVQEVGAKITLNNNGYEGVVVYITSKVVRDNFPLIEAIKDAFTKASTILFYATKNRAYFRNITIVVPKTWSKISINGTAPTVSKFDPHIRIDRASKGFGHKPYTRGNLVCGKSAWTIHLTPEYVKGNKTAKFGLPEKSIVHEWGHLRWGLFDEYASIRHRNTYPNSISFYNGGGKWNPVTCTQEITGTGYKGNCNVTRPCDITNLTMKACKFCPDQTQTATASLMASQWMGSVVSFCEKDDDTTPASVRHDSKAPNMMNKMCKGKSSWEVMEEHEDFFNGTNPPISVTALENPTFTIVKEASKVRVFVFDVSGSMRGTRIEQQEQSSHVVINNVVETGSFLGLVKFESSATILAPLTEVTNSSVREKLKDLVPNVASGGTRIYNGLDKAIDVIENSNQPTEGAEIVLLSDGQSYPYIQITPTLVNKGIIVHTIAISNAADPLMSQLAADTGGKSFTYLETQTVSFAAVLEQATTTNTQSETTALNIVSQTHSSLLTSSSPITGVFNIDEGLGNDTILTVILPSNYSITVNVMGPDNITHTKQESSSVVILKMDGTAVNGEYTYTISTTSFYTISSAEVRVLSSPVSDDADVVVLTSYVNSTTLDFDSNAQVQLIALVLKGETPVMNATVTAVLSADASFTPLNITLSDTGTGADIVYADGLYSAYLLKKYFTVNSAYTIMVYVEGQGDAYTMNVDPDNGADAIPGTVDDSSSTETTVGVFTRQSVPGEVTPANFVRNPPDTTPPSQITDFRVEDITKSSTSGVESIIYTLAWTAVGGDMDIGQAQKYDMRLNSNIQLLQSSFLTSALVPANLSSPQSSGVTETISVSFTLDHCVGICYLAVVATDENNLSGDISNIINIDIDFSYTVVALDAVEEDSTKESILVMLLLIVLACVLTLAILVLVVYKVFFKKSKIAQKVDPVFIMEQADANEKLRFQYYDNEHPDAVVPFDNTDFNCKPSFHDTQFAVGSSYPDARPFDDRTSIHSTYDDELNAPIDDVQSETLNENKITKAEYNRAVYVDPIFAIDKSDVNARHDREQ